MNPPRILTRVLSGIPLFDHPFIGDSSDIGQSQSGYACQTYDVLSAPKHACAAPPLPLVGHSRRNCRWVVSSPLLMRQSSLLVRGRIAVCLLLRGGLSWRVGKQENVSTSIQQARHDMEKSQSGYARHAYDLLSPPKHARRTHLAAPANAAPAPATCTRRTTRPGLVLEPGRFLPRAPLSQATVTFECK